MRTCRVLARSEAANAHDRRLLSQMRPAFICVPHPRPTHRPRRSRRSWPRSANMHASARALAYVGAAAVGDGAIGGVRLMRPETAEAMRDAMELRIDATGGVEYAMSQGGLADLGTLRGPTARGDAPVVLDGFVGWYGMGGSLFAMHASSGVSLAYVPLGMGIELHPDQRSIALARAVRQALGLRPCES